MSDSLAGWCCAVGSADQALSLLESDEWETWSLDLQGKLTEFLDRTYRQRYQDWNRIVERAKETVVPHEPAIAQGLRAAQLVGTVPLNTARWDVMGALVCAGFMDCKPPTDVLNLLDIYEAGHVPVGWDVERKRVLVY